MRRIYDGFDISSEIEPTIWREVLTHINKASVEGLVASGHTTHEERFLTSIRHSNEVFAAFKCHSMGAKMQERLHDEEGKLRSFDDWKKSVASIASHHTGAWLRTEYDTAVLRAHQAADWQEFERNKDILPNLRWMPTTSPSPEEAHKAFWASGLTLPIDDPFWKENHPANRWNCKCSLEATDAPTTHWEHPTNTPKPQLGLEENPRHGHTFSDKHPYFPKSCAACPFYTKGKGRLQNLLGRVFDNRRKDCYECGYIDDALDKAKEPRKIKLSLTEEQKEYRKALQDEARKLYQGKEIDTEIGKVRITSKGIKEFLNQPHSRYFEKNELVRELPKLLEEAAYLGSSVYHKDNDEIVRSHIFSTKALDIDTYLIAREDKTGIISFYSISDSDKVLIGLNKK